jgi:hypothetical protein
MSVKNSRMGAEEKIALALVLLIIVLVWARWQR